MADHVRDQIKTAIIAALEATSLTSVYLYSERNFNIDDDRLPAINVTSDDQESELLCKTPRYTRNVLRVGFEVFARPGEKDKALNVVSYNDILKVVESAIFTDVTLGGLCQKTTKTGTLSVERENEAQAAIIKAAQFYDFIYITIDGAADVAI